MNPSIMLPCEEIRLHITRRQYVISAISFFYVSTLINEFFGGMFGTMDRGYVLPQRKYNKQFVPEFCKDHQNSTECEFLENILRPGQFNF